MKRNLIVCDIHGMYNRLLSVLARSGFAPEQDNLYAVGDFCDRGPEPIKVLDYLMSLPHFYPIVGNHDIWLYEYLSGCGPANIWLDPRNGGKATYEVFKDIPQDKKTQIRQWYGSFPFLRTTQNSIILHAGPPSSVANGKDLLRLMDGMTLAEAFRTKRFVGSYISLVDEIVWDRDYIRSAVLSEAGAQPSREPFETDKMLICGHTPLNEVFQSHKYNITCIDTGSFVPEGRITVMDMDSGELFFSE